MTERDVDGAVQAAHTAFLKYSKVNPRVRVLARTSYLRELEELREAGVDAVFSGEGEVALAMAESIMRSFGATPEQVDRERERVRSKLFSAKPEALKTADA